MAHKDFGAARREAVGDPITFSLGGQTFEVPAPFPVLPLMDLASLDPTESGQEAMAAFRDCLLGMIDDTDHARFRKACRTARADADLLGEIVQWVIPQATGRPTERRPSSDDSPSNTGPESSGGSPEPPEEIAS
jgi:hypothetical protein